MTGKSLLLSFVACLSLCCSSTGLNAKSEDWQDLQGNSFKGEPIGTFGPMLFFKTSSGGSRRLLFRQLSKENCVRAFQQLKAHPERAADWSNAKGDVSFDLYNNVMKVDGEKLVPCDLKGRPEPAFLIVLYVWNNEGNSWGMLGAANDPYKKLVADHPGYVEMVMFSRKNSRGDQINMATSQKVNYLVADWEAQSNMPSLSRYAPEEGYSLVILSREGSLINVVENPDWAATQAAITAFGGMLDAIRPDRPKAWADMAYYQLAIQPVIHANDTCPPTVIGTPIRVDVLRARKIAKLHAQVRIDAEGKVQGVEVDPAEGMSDKLRAGVAEAMKIALYIPAVDHGKFVDGVFDYTVETGK
jgi:hypothetical protein